MKNTVRARLLEQFETFSLKRSPQGELFTLASGKKSSFYFDVKQSAQRAEVMEDLAEALMDVWLPMPGASCLAGVVLGGCHLATLLAAHLVTRGFMQNVVYVRKEPKDHGTGNLLEGPTKSMLLQQTIVVEDVFTTGGSSKSAIQALEAAGHKVVGLIVVLDRRNPADRPDIFMGIPVRSLFKLEDFGLVDDAATLVEVPSSKEPSCP